MKMTSLDSPCAIQPSATSLVIWNHSKLCTSTRTLNLSLYAPGNLHARLAFQYCSGERIRLIADVLHEFLYFRPLLVLEY